MGVKEIALVCGFFSGVAGVISAVAFLKGSAAMPWEIQSHKGKTEAEETFRSTAKRWNRAGLMALGVAFGLSAAASVASYYS